ncbi:uncharacterized protein [Lolium perenne]|uniref:uncharacterized protein isoform X2 n=1 Tax=Lolium perenne TaxID=4522 RepID=UPI0021F527DC|nr:uncharacterized protein LOC127300359 isoform X2 [Lolium perenne]
MRGKKRPLSPPAVAADATARLDERHLAEILLRLPSPASLARAAVVCRRWRRISISPAFLRRFRRLNPPQLVGFFICNGGFTAKSVGDQPVGQILEPTFLPALPPPRGVGGSAARYRDFSLRGLPDVDRWTLADARDGLLLFSSVYDDRMTIPRNFVVCDPLSGRSVLVRDAPRYQPDDKAAYLGAALVTVDGGDGASTLSFEVLLVTYFMSGPRLSVFSSRTGQWSVLPEAKCGNSLMPRLSGVGKPTHANGCVYWVMDNEFELYLLVLDTRTKKFSTSVRLLASMREEYASGNNLRVLRSEDGELRIVAMAWRSFGLHVWFLDRSRSTKGRWVRERAEEVSTLQGVSELLADVCNRTIKIMDAGEGAVFLKVSGLDWVYVVNLEERNVLKLPHQRFSSGPALPYRMELCPPLPKQAQAIVRTSMREQHVRGKQRRLSPPAVTADAMARLDERHHAEILLRLPSPASLALAAVVCRRWRRISISPDFLRRFRRLNPPQLVGFFICNGGFTAKRIGDRLVGQILEPTFLPVLPPPRGVGGSAARYSEFSLRDLPDIDRWTLADARDGLLLFSSIYHDRMTIPRNFVVCDPLSGRSFLVRDAPRYRLDDEAAYLGAALVTMDGGAGASTLSFEVILVTYFMFGPRLSIFSSCTGQWSVLPEAKCGKSLMPMLSGVGEPAHTNGCVYWVMDDDRELYLLMLDTHTKEFSTSIKLSASMREQYRGNMRVLRNEDGELRIVAMAWKSFALHVWLLDRSRSTKGRWVRETVGELSTFQGVFELCIADVSGGTIKIMDAGEGAVFFKKFGSNWVHVVNLEERTVLKLPHQRFSSGPALPYRMALCPPLPNQVQGQDG